MSRLPTPTKYLDDVQFMRAWFSDPAAPINQREMAKRLGCSPGHLGNVIHGRRRPEASLIDGLAERMHLPASERRYFLLLNRLRWASSAERDELLPQILAIQGQRHLLQTAEVPPDGPPPMPNGSWLHRVVWAMAGLEDIEQSPAELAKRLNVSVTHKQIKQALADLEAAGFIASDDSGRLRHVVPVHKGVPPGRDLPLVRAVQLQAARDAVQVAGAAIDWDFPSGEGLTVWAAMSVNMEHVEGIRRGLMDLRETITEVVTSKPGKTDRVYQLMLQLVPLTSLPSADGGQGQGA